MLQAWSASIEVPGVQTFAVTADYVGGTADTSELMGDAEVRVPKSITPCNIPLCSDVLPSWRRCH